MSDSTKKSEVVATSLSEDEIVEQAPGRRSVLALLSATVLGGAAKALGGCIVSNPQPVQTGPQPQAVVVQGGGGYQTGLTDSDSGSYADPVNNGRGGYRGVVTGLTDGDSGSWSDPVGNGRGTARFSNTGITDGDSGSWADPVGGGRGHR